MPSANTILLMLGLAIASPSLHAETSAQKNGFDTWVEWEQQANTEEFRQP